MKIVLCGSMRFAPQMRELQKTLENHGHSIILPLGFEEGKQKLPRSEDIAEKKSLDVFRRYFEEIRVADAILIGNFDKDGITGYIGGNALIEMAFAHVLNKKVFLLNPIPTLPYSDEIEAMSPMVLNGNLTAIKE